MIIARTLTYVSPSNTALEEYSSNTFACTLTRYPAGHHRHPIPALKSHLSSAQHESLFLPNASSEVVATAGSTEIDTTMFLLPENPLLSPLFVAVVALVLLISAQTFINKMLEGDQGLGAFLKDGAGYNRSGFRTRTRSDVENDIKENDPLPWLKLPRLDFVEVAGQADLPSQGRVTDETNKNFSTLDPTEQQRVYDELEGLRLRLNYELEKVRRDRSENPSAGEGKDDMAEANRLKTKLERLMKLYGIEYEVD